MSVAGRQATETIADRTSNKKYKIKLKSSAPALLSWSRRCYGLCPLHPPPPQLFLGVSEPPAGRSEHVRALFDSTQSQESKSEVSVHNGTRQCALGPI